MLDFQHLNFFENTKFDDLAINLDVSEIYIDKSTIGANDQEKTNYNFLAVGRKNDEAKKVIATLSSNNFFLVEHKAGVSVFKKNTDSNEFLKNFKNPLVRTWNDTFYTLEKPVIDNVADMRLLVVFSSIADLPFNANIDRRMFFKNFQSIAKYIPKNTYILRIADVGGVLGSFYLNSNADMQFEDKVQRLIRKVQMDCGVSDSHTVLYGTSKGATGALYHGVKMGVKAVAVDPIISDVHYMEKHNDMHFVKGAFPIFKQEKFAQLFVEYKDKNLTHIKLVTSPNSEQFEYINDLILSQGIGVCTYVFSNPNIKGHTTIGENTLNFVTAMLNSALYNIDAKSTLVTSC